MTRLEAKEIITGIRLGVSEPQAYEHTLEMCVESLYSPTECRKAKLVLEAFNRLESEDWRQIFGSISSAELRLVRTVVSMMRSISKVKKD